MNVQWVKAAVGLIVILACGLGCEATVGSGAPTPVAGPDYTKGETLKLSPRIWSIGPTGAFGNIWYDEHHTENARMVQITAVTEGSPADGVLKAGDVILGVGDRAFTSDPRRAIAQAITDAETPANDGQLVFKVWRPLEDGRADVSTITLMLPVKGRYSATSPWDCDKTNALINDACEAIVKRGLFSKDRNGKTIRKAGVNRTIDALGLLATGDAKYLPLVKDYVAVVSRMILDPQAQPQLKSWHLAYMNILMCEYYLLTGDRSVLPAIEACASRIVDGRSGVGTWGHSMRMPNQRYASGYGSMNQIGLTLTISLILTQRCGVEVNDLDKAVAQSLDFFRYFVGKGSIPYGDHGQSGAGFAGNGKSAQAAVMFDLAGEPTGAAYFTRMTLASYGDLEVGHTGHFFNGLWGPMGAARGGEQAARSYSNAIRWFTETERRFDGSFVFQPGLTKTNQHKYSGWSTTGVRLLHYCLPRKKLLITGRGRGTIPAITGRDLKQAADAGRIAKALRTDPTQFTMKQLLDLLGSWAPAVRLAAAVEIGQRDEDVVSRLISMLDSEDRHARYGACAALHFAGRRSEKAVDALAAQARQSSDPLLRHFAIMALAIPRAKEGDEQQFRHALGEASRKAGPVLLQLAATPIRDDPMNRLHLPIAEILFYGGTAHRYTGHYPNGQGLANVDRALLVKAVKSLLANPNGRARSMVAGVYPKLTQTELDQLWADIYRATKHQAPSGVMFSFEARASGLALLAEHGYAEGIDLAMAALRQEGWGHHKRDPAALKTLLAYGQAIQKHLPEIKTIIDDKIQFLEGKRGDRSKEVQELQMLWQQLQQTAQTPRRLKTLAGHFHRSEGDHE